MRRRRLTCESMVRVDPASSSPCTSSSSWSRLRTCPGRRASAASSRNSEIVSGTRPSVERRLLPVEVERSAAAHETSAPAGAPPLGEQLAAPQQDPDPRPPARAARTAWQIVVGAHLEPEHAVELLPLRGQHQDRQRPRASTQPRGSSTRRAAAAGCRQDEVRQRRRERLPRDESVANSATAKPSRRARRRGGTIPFVVHHRDARRRAMAMAGLSADPRPPSFRQLLRESPAIAGSPEPVHRACN